MPNHVKEDRPSKIHSLAHKPALSVAERRFRWLRKQHPKMSHRARQLWAFGSQVSP
jgi:hypothetical protein